MSRDWDAEEVTLRAQATEAFEVLMGIRKAASGVSTHKAEIHARYVAEDALEAYRKAKAELEAFLEDRRASDSGWREM